MVGARPVAVVTGGGRGLGRAAVLRLVQDGFDVGIFARSSDQVEAVAKEVEALGARALGLAVDVTSSDSIGAAQARVVAELGAVQVVVNNAGNLLYKPFVPLPGLHASYPGFDTAMSDEEWSGVMDVHLGGAIRMLRAFGPGMIDRGNGRVVNVVSNVVRRTVPFTIAYDTAKGALVQLTRSLAREWARYGITVNAVAAGHFPTEMTRAQFEDEASYKRMIQRVPVGRAGELDEFAGLISYLCSGVSAYVTGELIAVDGGETL